MSGALIGWLPLGRPVRLADGRHLTMDAGSLDDWAQSFDLVPVLLGHDPHKPVGWVTKARVKLDCLYLFGELDDTFDPQSRAAGHVIRGGIVQGLSPLVITRAGTRRYGDRRCGPGEVYSFPELSVVGTPRVPRRIGKRPPVIEAHPTRQIRLLTRVPSGGIQLGREEGAAPGRPG